MTTQGTLNGHLFEGSIKGGTPQLFDTKEMLTDKARYPRGYTPERMRDVAENGPRVYGPTVSGSQSSPAVIAAAKAAALPARRVRDNLARSTVPMGGELKATQIHTGQEFGTNHITGGSTGGEYIQPGEGRIVHRIRLAPGLEDKPTLIHELGHLDSVAKDRDHSSYRTPQAQGAEEAYADDYAMTHFRDRRGRTARPDGGYIGSVNAGKTSVEFAQQYKASRTTLPPEAPPKTYRHPLVPSNHVPGQMPLLAGVVTGFGTSETADWDYNFPDPKTPLPGEGLKRETSTPVRTPRSIKAEAKEKAWSRHYAGLGPKPS